MTMPTPPPPPPRRHPLRILLAAGLLATTSCAFFSPPPPGPGEPISWKQIRGWTQDNHAEAWPALQQTCAARGQDDRWQDLCYAATFIIAPSNHRARRFFERWFTPRVLYGNKGANIGLITGYYEPLLHGSLTPDSRYRYPLYAPPPGLLTIDISTLYPELAGRRVRGRVVGDQVLPFYSRAEIDADQSPLAGNELLWVDDPNAVFFLHIQGSGRIRLPDGRIVGAGYDNQNGHPYHSIGKILLQRGELPREQISLFTIRRWLRDHPARAQELLFSNPSYVFFTLRDTPATGPIGTLGVPLTPERSLAIDPDIVELGTPVWLSTTHPATPNQPYRRLVMAQDTGGAIKGNIRADLFWGHGQKAEQAAGTMKHPGRMIILQPKPPTQ